MIIDNRQVKEQRKPANKRRNIAILLSIVFLSLIKEQVQSKRIGQSKNEEIFSCSFWYADRHIVFFFLSETSFRTSEFR